MDDSPAPPPAQTPTLAFPDRLACAFGHLLDLLALVHWPSPVKRMGKRGSGKTAKVDGTVAPNYWVQSFSLLTHKKNRAGSMSPLLVSSAKPLDPVRGARVNVGGSFWP